MKVDIVDDNIIVFLNKYLTKDLDYNDSKVLEIELKKIFDRLEYLYNIKIKGYYDIYIYIDNNYGIVMELVSDSIDYMDYDEVIDMKIIVNNVKLLYKVDDIINIDIPYKVYLYKNNLYLDIDSIDNIGLGNLLEHSNIIYKNVDEIRYYGHILKK